MCVFLCSVFSSLSCFFVFFLMIRRPPRSTRTYTLFPYTTLFPAGAAMATFFIPLTTLTLAGLDPHRIPAAAGLSNFVRLLFGAFGTSITTTLWDNRAGLHHARLTEVARPGEPAFDSVMNGLQQKGLSHEQSASIIHNLIGQQSYTMSAVDIFYASAILF